MLKEILAMDKPNDKTLNSTKIDDNKAVDEYIAGLSEEHRMLVVLKSQLYGGSWEPMLDDLKNRLEGKPYIFKLVNRIKDDIERIQEMKSFEEVNHIDLADFIELP